MSFGFRLRGAVDYCFWILGFVWLLRGCWFLAWEFGVDVCSLAFWVCGFLVFTVWGVVVDLGFVGFPGVLWDFFAF